MKKIIDYNIIQSCERGNLIGLVKQAMNNDGWQPIGGLTIQFSDDCDFFAQAVVKYEENLISDCIHDFFLSDGRWLCRNCQSYMPEIPPDYSTKISERLPQSPI